MWYYMNSTCKSLGWGNWIWVSGSDCLHLHRSLIDRALVTGSEVQLQLALMPLQGTSRSIKFEDCNCTCANLQILQIIPEQCLHLVLAYCSRFHAGIMFTSLFTTLGSECSVGSDCKGSLSTMGCPSGCDTWLTLLTLECNGREIRRKQVLPCLPACHACRSPRKPFICWASVEQLQPSFLWLIKHYMILSSPDCDTSPMFDIVSEREHIMI